MIVKVLYFLQGFVLWFVRDWVRGGVGNVDRREVQTLIQVFVRFLLGRFLRVSSSRRPRWCRGPAVTCSQPEADTERRTAGVRARDGGPQEGCPAPLRSSRKGFIQRLSLSWFLKDEEVFICKASLDFFFFIRGNKRAKIAKGRIAWHIKNTAINSWSFKWPDGVKWGI